jgi:NAD(P)-dependent dehydrogenase (short-subunit alcohol dehydrogenase family)
MGLALITGAQQGLGLETAKHLSALGHEVVLTGRTAEKLEAVASGMTGARWMVMDVSDDASVTAAFQGLTHLDMLINCAGRLFGRWSDGMEVPAARIAEAIDNNALSAWRTMQLALPMMAAAGYGRVVNVSSGMGELASMGPSSVAYRLSKAALNAMTLVGAKAAAPGVKVNAVCPGWVRTEMGGSNATRSLDEGAAGIVWAATLPEDGPNGGFFRDGKRIDW